MKTNKSSLLRKLLLATLAAVMMLSTAAMAKTVTVKWNSSKKIYYKAYTAQTSGNLYFKLQLKQNGLLDVSGFYKSIYGSNYGYDVTLLNGNGTCLDYHTSGNYINSLKEYYVRYAVTPGTYYFKVKASEGCKYIFGANFKTKCANAGGTSKARALTLPRGKVATGVISAYSFKQARWFKFYVPQQSKPVKLVVQLNGGQGYTNAYIAGPNLKKTASHSIDARLNRTNGFTYTMSQRVSTGGYSYTTGPKAGWYYLLLTKDTSGNNKRSSGQFAVKWDY